MLHISIARIYIELGYVRHRHADERLFWVYHRGRPVAHPSCRTSDHGWLAIVTPNVLIA